MNLPLDLLAKYNITASGSPRNEREELLGKFLERLNPSRVKDGLPVLTIGRMVKLFEGVPTSDIYPFFKSCEGARSFSRLFWSLIKPKKKV